ATGHERELLDAIALAEEAVPGTRAIDLDREDDGAKYEIEVTDGTTLTKVEVEGGAARVEESEPLEADERAEFEAAVITIQEAIRKALDTWPGIVDDIELDEDGDLNAVVWEFTIHQDGREIEVWVDAATGEPGE
ncbi:MAG: PepSY domain-containing protein, partial [bacterium]|nr:PepSY domain-containing protein [bacterium]